MPDYSKLVRKMEWEGDVLHVHDVVKEISDNMEKQMEEVVLNHFDCDFSDFREYMHDKIKWERKQELAMPRWIPVTERLPEEWHIVMTYQPTPSWMEDGIGLRRTAVYIGNGKWREAEKHNMMELPVTHWMPLPEPPKGEKED